MIKVGITGSLASGKTTASKILSYRRGPLFSADKVVRELYQKRDFKNTLCKKFNLQNKNKIKINLKKKILKDSRNIRKLEKIIHPLVRNRMESFTNKNKKRKTLFYEIPLLIESKLMENFDVIIFIKARKKIRLKRFLSKNGNKKIFNLLDNKQLSERKKIKYCDYVVVNENNIKILKRKLLTIIKNYE